MREFLRIPERRQRIPNPMYIFSGAEANKLQSLYIPELYRESNSLTLINVPFTEARNNAEALKIFIGAKSLLADRIVICGTFHSTLKTPHHIHANGEMEEQPGREGPIRTYFDGSSIEKLGHAVAICVDRSSATITTQCPKGLPLEESAATILDGVFKGFAHHTITHRQQKDQHSCFPLTLRNIFAFAGVMPPADQIDITVWRKELLEKLEGSVNLRKKVEALKALFEASVRDKEPYAPEPPKPIYQHKYMPEPR